MVSRTEQSFCFYNDKEYINVKIEDGHVLKYYI